jgi:beta-glucosidase
MKEFKGNFPENFYWGTAISALQTEGDNINSDWWDYTEAGKIGKNVKIGKATNHYELYESDFDLVQGLNNNAFRFSIEWSRIEPEPGKFDLTEVEHYRNYIVSLKRRGIEPFVTLYHFSLPSWFLEKGGWLNKNSAKYFARYARFLMENLLIESGVRFVITINEPLIYSFISYYSKRWPPQEHSLIKTIRVALALVKAHKAAKKAITKSSKETMVGLSHFMTYFEPYPKNSINNFFASTADHFWNRYFLNKIKRHIDFIGLNYYQHDRVSFSLGKIFNPKKIFTGNNENLEVSDMGWEIYPSGIYYLLMELKKYKKPIFITENGVADEKDKIRSAFIMEHLKYVWKAMRDGADVRGYFYWSLLDNMELDHGYGPRFGLFEVDYADLSRRPRVSARVYADIARQNKII